ncbi:hypothetical protein QWZ14_00810 [Paeniroseomonas aquatica]|uniref:CsbD family protein n=1 Tax=Paeniroseomonas aquatica TaxID=373043 RepID=A0ABT7ZZM2_9PROT|nr:hypothetical protein [Paeniroseomonas aquatica]MDN3562922.1 hypothetical protein [Paeniroseomonas aquatica]
MAGRLGQANADKLRDDGQGDGRMHEAGEQAAGHGVGLHEV